MIYILIINCFIIFIIIRCNSFFYNNNNNVIKRLKGIEFKLYDIINNEYNNIDIKQSRTYGADNFGDLMGGCETNMIVGGSFTPLERIIITANGNLQRIMSAYYGAPVIVNILKCDPIEDITLYKNTKIYNDNTNKNTLLCVYDREVTLLMNDQIFCTAKGLIEIYDKELIDAIEYKKIGIGQIFRYLGALPSFKLHAAGKKQDGSLWRDYSLYLSDKINCHFVEEFTTNLFNLKVNS
jgi:hypothetical protein